MMTFEDIVDMDWLDSHSVKGEPMDLFPNDYVDFNHYLSNDLLSPKPEVVSSPPPLLMASPPPSGMLTPTTATSCSAAAALAAATTTPPPPLTFPTTEQIKQLIELAKHQLALRASQTNVNNTSSTDNTSPSSSASNDNDPCNKSQTASSSDAAVTAPLHTTTPTQHQHQLTTLIKTEQDGTVPSLSRSSSPPSLISDDNNNDLAIPMDIEEKVPSRTTTINNKNNNKKHHLHRDDIGTLEAYAESDGIDIKKLTPKERRQLRNKISARNFRVRRKEYITTLEQQVNDHKKHADSLAEQLGRMEGENKQLRQEVDTLKRQNLLLQQQQQQ
ncbi:hypothetical protein BCR42DRAFT_401961 [Absidia repens]|uniref:BZIP domain-containing protein n=1 Tax=Absidia repens TaxID=90262 RepID=A0A1X2IXG7_9FUNG|nr:hypothetical protein BCR42DRAFT_401961 [Absidia repens]